MQRTANSTAKGRPRARGGACAWEYSRRSLIITTVLAIDSAEPMYSARTHAILGTQTELTYIITDTNMYKWVFTQNLAK